MTTSGGIRVPRDRAEQVRRELLKQGVLRSGLKPLREGDFVVFPFETRPEGITGEMVEVDFEATSEGPRSYMDRLQLPPELVQQLPSSFDVIGTIVAIRLEGDLLPYQKEIGEALLSFVPRARTVAVDHGVQGPTRVRALEVVAGEDTLRTRYRENGVDFEVDLGRVYCSPRLAREHAYIAGLVTPGERVLDLFCGFGPFGLTILRKHADVRVVSVDLNPQAIEFLRDNARRLRVEDRIEAKCLDAAVFLEEESSFDRVIMNLPREGYKYLPKVGSRVKGPGWLHFYGLVPRDQQRSTEEMVLSHLTSEAANGRWTLEGSREVHPYSPSQLLMAFTLRKHGESEVP